MIKLNQIGYWHSFEYPTAPDPAWFIDNSWNIEEKQMVIVHLKKGQILHCWMGYSWCRFRCGKEILGANDLTNGMYVWPEGLAHYLENHDIRLPQIFVEHVLNYAEHELNIIENEANIKCDQSWWIKQKGWHQNQSSFKSVLDIGILRILQISSIDLAAQEKFQLII